MIVASPHTNSVWIFASSNSFPLTLTLLAKLTDFQLPRGIAITPDGTRAYVLNGSDSVKVINVSTNAVIADIPVGSQAGVPLGIDVGDVPVRKVSIDIKPGSFPNSINLDSAGVVPVAILGSSNFDVRQVDQSSLTLAGARVKLIGKGDRYSCGIQHVNSDQYLDLVCHVVTAQFMIEPGDSMAVLEGTTLNGKRIRGEDSIRIVPR